MYSILAHVFRGGETYPEVLVYVASLNGEPRDQDSRCPWGRELRPGDCGQEEGLLFTENSLYCLNSSIIAPVLGQRVSLPPMFVPTLNLRIGCYLETGSLKM